MKVKDKVTSKELSKRMVKLGWDYETERYWKHTNEEEDDYILGTKNGLYGFRQKDLNAPDAIEIMSKLPKTLNLNTQQETVSILQQEWSPRGECWEMDYRAYSSYAFYLGIIKGKTEAEVRGNLWCYLKEKGLI